MGADFLFDVAIGELQQRRFADHSSWYLHLERDNIDELYSSDNSKRKRTIFTMLL